MTRLPRIPGLRIVSVLKHIGFEVIGIKGSHYFLRHPDGRTTVVPVHRGEDIGPGLMNQILRDCEITADEFREKL